LGRQAQAQAQAAAALRVRVEIMGPEKYERNNR
jgi:hypothetical protein